MPDDAFNIPRWHHQHESANTIARRFAEATADELMADLRRVVGDAERAMEALLDEGFSAVWIYEALGNLMDDAADKVARINKDLDAAGSWNDRALDMADLRALRQRAHDAMPAHLREG